MRSRLRKVLQYRHGFSLVEQVVAAALLAVVVPPLALLLTGLMRQASLSNTRVTMVNLARSQIESVKAHPYQELPASYSDISPLPEGFTITITASAVKTYTYPPPDSTSTLPNEIQLITVEVSCPNCSPAVNPLTLQDYKVKR
jgi:Tfp pilus assembly protein PilV